MRFNRHNDEWFESSSPVSGERPRFTIIDAFKKFYPELLTLATILTYWWYNYGADLVWNKIHDSLSGFFPAGGFGI